MNLLTYKQISDKALFENKGFEITDVRSYLDGFARMNAGGKQKEFWIWQAEQAEPVDIKSYKSLPELQYMVDDFLENCGNECVCKQKECYSTAYEMAKWSSDIDYVEGYVLSIIPMQHAWNYHKPSKTYFDLMNEVTWNSDGRFTDYHKVIQIPSDFALLLSFRKTWNKGGVGEYISDYFFNKDEDWFTKFI